MACEYMKYNESEKQYFPRLYCSIDDKQCIYAKRCDKEGKFIPNGDLWEECYKMILEQIKNIPKGSYFVQTYRPNSKGKLFLYVVIDETVEKILTDFTELNQNYVYLKKELDEYKVSLTPFETKKASNVRTTKSATK